MTTEGEAPHAKINYEHPSSYDGYYYCNYHLGLPLLLWATPLK